MNTLTIQAIAEKQVPNADKRHGAMSDIDKLDGFFIGEQVSRLGLQMVAPPDFAE